MSVDSEPLTATASNVDVDWNQLSPNVIDGELAGVVAAVCAKFPQLPRAYAEGVVHAAYRHLRSKATITTHLIPLTLNRSMRIVKAACATAPISSTGSDRGSCSA